MKRIAIAFFYDANGIVDDYMINLVNSLKPFVERTIFVSNGNLATVSLNKVKQITSDIIERPNEGLDVGAYKAGLNYIGFDALKEYDEILLYNHTFFGPIYPFSKMFDVMEKRKDDFWGISAHKATETAFFGAPIPYHIQSHFIALRQSIISKPIFKEYWDNLPEIKSYGDSVRYHESQLTRHFEELGFQHSTYIDGNEFNSLHPIFEEVDEFVACGCPIIKRRNFFHDPMILNHWATNLPRALRIIKEKSDYDLNLIWQNVVRTVKPRDLNATSARMSILSDSVSETQKNNCSLKIGIFIHLFYVDDIDHIAKHLSHLNRPFDLFISTGNEKNAAIIETYFRNNSYPDKITVRVVEENRGRDMSSLFITFRDILLTDQYDLACRLHSKKSPQNSASQSRMFAEHLMDNLIASKPYVDNVIHLFMNEPRLGLAMPPVIHIGYPTLGFSWWANKAKVEEICKNLNIEVPLDDDTPVAPYGTMFWFRPKALRKLFFHNWKWTDFNAEPNHSDGGLAHALERTIAYATHDAGYYTQHIMSTTQAPFNYAMMEYKLQKIMSRMPSSYPYQVIEILDAQKDQNEQEKPVPDPVHRLGSRKAYKLLKSAFKVYATEAGKSFKKKLKHYLQVR